MADGGGKITCLAYHSVKVLEVFDDPVPDHATGFCTRCGEEVRVPVQDAHIPVQVQTEKERGRT